MRLSFERHMPDPFALAVALLLLTCGLAWGLTDANLAQIARAVHDGVFSLLSFTMQMVLVLFFGGILAKSEPVQRLLNLAVGRLKTPTQALVALTLLSAFLCWLNWGLGLICSAYLAVEVGRRNPHFPYGLLVAAAYSGFVVWHGGLSGSIPLTVNTPDHFASAWTGGVIGLRQTIFSVFNFTLVAGLVVSLLLCNLWLLKARSQGPEGKLAQISIAAPASIRILSREALPLRALGLVLILAISYQWLELGPRLDLNSLNLVLLLFICLSFASLSGFLQAANEVAPQVGPVILQYPIYAAIMGVMTKTPLGEVFSSGLMSFATKESVPLLTFWSAGFLNLFIPSGGGQFAVQGPIVLPAALAMGADIPLTLMAIAWGDAWTNLIQPFWALPLLAIAGLKAAAVLRYTIWQTLVLGLVISLWFALASRF